jgi:6-phosphogluconolactonase
MKKQIIPVFAAAVTLLVLVVPAVGAVPNFHSYGTQGAVYIMSNSPSGNQVIVYTREANGSLTWFRNFATKGLGINGLAGTNQGGLALTSDGRWLLVVNAGSNDVSVFRVGQDGLTLTDVANSGGLIPTSVTVHENWVYVLDNGTASTAGNIAGFYLNHGQLSPISGSIQPLSGLVTTAQISFNPRGTVLAVTEKSSSLIDTYTVNRHGVASAPTSTPSSGATPFGFAFDQRGTLIVSEAGGGPSGTSAVSSYSVSKTGKLTTISASVPDTGLAACWLVVTGNSRYAYTDNAHGGTVSSYTVSRNGSLTLLQATAATTVAGNLDMALSSNSHFLYIFVHGSNSIEGFSVNHDGSLELVTTVTGVPATADGLAAN